MTSKKHSTVGWLQDNSILHIECPLGIVNIRRGHDAQGDDVTSIEILPDDGITLDGQKNTRLVKETSEVSIVLNYTRKYLEKMAGRELTHNDIQHLRRKLPTTLAPHPDALGDYVKGILEE